ncbi:dienelactone hydrolase family protein [Glacieibacterium megasporae]|uniref:dienelactone hydrolase family protein n=1 Tax=Glacieibacterium megasporae TaxID=2835787 RepID=UPI001C1E16CA|nr:dienelactone hydrolase family protein [Polymorphobacter megasporae]UAJ12601.1 dienelactone hydrolase family protein [Polymorphobacter megasporae]
MKAAEVIVATPSGPMRSFIVHPEADIPCPVVIVYMDFWGYRDELMAIARRAASVGYYCIVPDFYHREDATVLNQFFGADGRTLSVFNLDKAQLAIAAAPLHRLSDTMVLDDTRAVLDHADRDPAALATRVGAIGFCMGGRHAISAAEFWPDRFVATASLHGSYLISGRPESPHRALDRLRGELYCGYAESDVTADGDMIARFEALLAGQPVRYSRSLHTGTHHGYALTSRDVYDLAATERDWELIFAMFQRTIPPYCGTVPR